MDHRLPRFRPTQLDRIERASVHRESEVICYVTGSVSVMKRAGRHFGWSLTIRLPRSRTVSGISVHPQPRSHFLQHLLNLVRNGAVRSRPDIQQQIAILADYVDELAHNELRLLERVVLYKAPRSVANGRVRLPIQRAYVAKLAPLEIQHRRMVLHRVVLVVDDPHVVAILERRIVIEGGKARQV